MAETIAKLCEPNSRSNLKTRHGGNHRAQLELKEGVFTAVADPHKNIRTSNRMKPPAVHELRAPKYESDAIKRSASVSPQWRKHRPKCPRAFSAGARQAEHSIF